MTAGRSAIWATPTAPSSTNVSLGPGEWAVRPHDIVRYIGNVMTDRRWTASATWRMEELDQGRAIPAGSRTCRSRRQPEASEEYRLRLLPSREENAAAGDRDSSSIAARSSSGPSGKRRRAAAYDPAATPSSALRANPCTPSSPTWTVPWKVLACSWVDLDNSKHDRQPHRLQPKPGLALPSPKGNRSCAPSVDEDPSLAGATQHCRGDHGIRPLRSWCQVPPQTAGMCCTSTVGRWRNPFTQGRS